MLLRFSFYIALLFVAGLLKALPAATVIAELPMQFREGLLWVEVTVAQSDQPLSFLVDSGASASVLDLATTRRLGLQLGPKVEVTAVATTLAGHWPVKFSGKLGPISLPGEYLGLDLSKLSRACNRAINGLIGADFFRGRVVQLDYAAGKLRLLSLPPATATSKFVPIQNRACGFRIAVNVNGGKRQWVRLDTGCATAFQWVTSKERAECRTSNPAVGLAELSIPQTMTGLRIGTYHFDTVPTGLHHKAIFPGESGLLGNGLLARFGVVTIDAKSGRLFLGRAGR
jgi:hypothetical protein